MSPVLCGSQKQYALDSREKFMLEMVSACCPRCDVFSASRSNLQVRVSTYNASPEYYDVPSHRSVETTTICMGSVRKATRQHCCPVIILRLLLIRSDIVKLDGLRTDQDEHESMNNGQNSTSLDKPCSQVWRRLRSHICTQRKHLAVCTHM